MKHLNQKTEAIIETRVSRVDWQTKVTEGEIVPHKEIVDYIKMYVPIYDHQGFVSGHNEVKIYRDAFLDISNQINEIEARIFDEPYYSDEPF